MVVEYALAASIPGFLITIHHMVQFSRPRIGYGSDVGGKRTPWIIGGMFILATGSLTAAFGATLIPSLGWLGAIVAALGYFLIGIGSAAAGTSLLILLSKLVSDQRKPAAASVVWFMMIMGFALTGGITGQLLDPFSEGRLLTVVAGVAVIALLVSCTAIIGIERSARVDIQTTAAPNESKPPFMEALKGVWQESHARRFTIFVFASMLAYSAQDLILEPFVGLTFGWSVGETTALAGVQHGGMLLGMFAMASTTYAFKPKLGTCYISGSAAAALFPGYRLPLWRSADCSALRGRFISMSSFWEPPTVVSQSPPLAG